MIEFILNHNLVRTDLPAGTVLLDYLRREQGLLGTKEGCREGDCGACTVLIGDGMRYHTATSCLVPIGDVQGQHVVTIEGLTEDDLSPIQQAIVDEGATQCGFCTPGIVTALAGFLLTSRSLTLDDAMDAVAGNICRCTGYTAIRRAVTRLVDGLGTFSPSRANRVQELVQAAQLPACFLDVAKQLKSLERKTDDACGIPVAGGTDLFVQRADELRERTLSFLSADDRLRGIEIADGCVQMGAMTSTQELLEHKQLLKLIPCWGDSLRLISSQQIRERASVAGNIVNASPIGDLSIMLLALAARLSIEGPRGAREIPLDRFYRSYKEYDLAKDELITSVTFTVPADGADFQFEKVSRRERLDIAGVNSAMLLSAQNGTVAKARLSAGGVAPIPLYLEKSSDWLNGRTLSRDTVAELLERVNSEISPIDDVRGSADYKRRLLRRLVIAHFRGKIPDSELAEFLK